MINKQENNSIHIAKKSQNPIINVLWIILGSFFVVLAVIGVIIPGLPTTLFLVLAGACYIRSSQRLYDWLIENKTFGPYLKNYREGKGIPKKAKILAITMIIIFVGYAILFGLKDIFLRIIVSILGLVGFLYVYFKVPVAKD